MMKSENEVRKMLEQYERMQKRNERKWLEDKVSYEYYLRHDDKLCGIIRALKMVLNEA